MTGKTGKTGKKSPGRRGRIAQPDAIKGILMKHASRFALFASTLVTALIQTAAAQDGDAAHVVTYIEVSPPSVQQAMELISAEVEAGRSDDGNLLFEAVQRIGQPNHFVLLETWTSPGTQQSHRDSDRTTAFREALAPLLYSPYDERLHMDLVASTQYVEPTADAVYAVTHVDVTPNNVEPALEHLQAMAAASLAEAGNERFEVLVQSNRSNHFTVVERWENAEAQLNHIDATHSRSFREAVHPLSGALYDERLYRAP